MPKREVLVMEIDVGGEHYYTHGFTRTECEQRANDQYEAWEEVAVMTQKEALCLS